MNRHVVIVGAGIIGASIAFHLSRAGIRVTVVDATGPGGGASGASDGAVAVATKQPGCLMSLALASRDYYSELAGEAGPLQGAYHECPTFLVATNDAEVGFLTSQASNLQAAGASTRTLSGSDLEAELPDLRQDVPLVLEVSGEGHALGYEVVDRFLRASDATVVRGLSVTGLDYRSGRCTGIRSGDAVIAADDVVISAGLGSSRLLDGVEIHPKRGQLVVTDRSPMTDNFPGPLFFASYLASKVGQPRPGGDPEKPASTSSLVIDPLRTRQFLIGSTREDSADADHTEFGAVQNILRQAVEFVPRIGGLDVVRVFAGIRASTPDGLPAVGAVPGGPGVWVATGFGGDGICLAPLVGRELSSLMTGGAMLRDLEEFNPGRLVPVEPAA